MVVRKKSDQLEVDRCQGEDLAINVAGVLNNEACPEQLRSAITYALCELQSRNDCLSNVDFLLGRFLSKPRQEGERGRRCPVKAATVKKQNQQIQVEMIPARVVWNHVDRLDGLH